MSNSRDLSVDDYVPLYDGDWITCDRDDQSLPPRKSYASEEASNLETVPWRSVPIWVSNDRADSYFDIYKVMSAQLPAKHLGPSKWFWRFCAPDGQIRASGGGYDAAEECRDAVDALRRLAGGARVRQMDEGLG
jgi:uncharacterized protein YegP (UPF0339 family)